MFHLRILICKQNTFFIIFKSLTPRYSILLRKIPPPSASCACGTGSYFLLWYLQNFISIKNLPRVNRLSADLYRNDASRSLELGSGNRLPFKIQYLFLASLRGTSKTEAHTAVFIRRRAVIHITNLQSSRKTIPSAPA